MKSLLTSHFRRLSSEDEITANIIQGLEMRATCAPPVSAVRDGEQVISIFHVDRFHVDRFTYYPLLFSWSYGQQKGVKFYLSVESPKKSKFACVFARKLRFLSLH